MSNGGQARDYTAWYRYMYLQHYPELTDAFESMNRNEQTAFAYQHWLDWETHASESV
jgi:hypothetical protein